MRDENTDNASILGSGMSYLELTVRQLTVGNEHFRRTKRRRSRSGMCATSWLGTANKRG